MKKAVLLFLATILMALPFTSAEEGGMDLVTINVVTPEEEAAELPEDVIEGAGVTPDNPLWGLERAMERISLALTPGKSAKAKKGLAHARERLMEVQAMVAARKLGAASQAQEVHDNIIDGVSDQIAELDDGDEEDLEDEVELEEALNEHRTLVQEINNIKLKTKGLTVEQQAQLNGMLASMDASTLRAQLSVRAKKDKTKLRIKATKNLSDEELEALEAQIKASVGEGAKLKIVGRKAESKAKGKFKTTELNEEEPEEQNVTPAAAKTDENTSKGKNSGKGRKK